MGGRKVKLIVFPYSNEYNVFAAYSALLTGYNEILPITIKGSGLDGKDMDVLNNGTEVGTIINSDFDGALGSADAVFFGFQDGLKKDAYLNKIIKSFDEKKKVYIIDKLLPLVYDVTINKNYAILSFDNINLEVDENHQLLSIPIPVVLVAGVGEKCDKFHVQLGLKDAFEKEGYRVSQWGTKAYSSLFGIKPLPKYLFDLHPTRDKIISFNHLVYDQAKRDKADVIIIGIPGGIMRSNPFMFDDFGEYAFIISNAVKADTGIICTYAIEMNEEFIEKLLSVCIYRLNMKPQYFNIATSGISITAEKKVTEYYFVSPAYINSSIISKSGTYKKMAFCSLEQGGMKKAAEGIINYLKENI